MKIGILTQPLHSNYGGLLQAYALKEVLKDLGNETVIINRDVAAPKSWRIIASRVKHALQTKKLNRKQKLSLSQKKIIFEHTSSFIKKNIPEQSKLITSNKKMKSLNNDDYNAFIIGSDQCWRPKYSPEIRNYFLDFAKKNSKIKRISYAASFGVSDWEFSKQQTKECKKLLKNFDAISVREKSGVRLVEQYLGRKDAIHVLDPTMLLQKSHYQKIIEQEMVSESQGTLKVYVLDKTNEKEDFINLIENELALKKFEVMPNKRIQSDIVTNTNINDFQYPKPAKWLKGFQDSEFVITDSFHGTLFSIIFNVPFITIGNKGRGMARFESVLEMFNFSDRLVTDINKADLQHLLYKKIDWKFANKVLERERIKALDFLIKGLE